MKKIIPVLLFILGLYRQAWGACDITADSCSSIDVQHAITTHATIGQTVCVPKGTDNCTWGAGAVSIAADKPINLQGAGIDNITIILSGNAAVTIGAYQGYPFNGTQHASRITGFKFVSPKGAGDGEKYTAIRAQGQGWRIDHCRYESVESSTSATAGLFVEVTGINSSLQPFGVIDHNYLINGKIDIAGPSSSENQSIAWSDALDLGGNTATYIEDNFFTTDYPNSNAKRLAIDDGYAAKYVARYNTFTNCDSGTHSLQSAGDRGPRKVEIYGNYYNLITDSVQAFIEVQAGTGVVFNNKMGGVADQHSNYALYLDNKRSGASVGCLGTCDGSHAWDGNSDNTGWPCRDQVGRGLDASTWADAACGSNPPAQSLVPLYAFNLWGAGNGNNVLITATDHIKANRDYYYTNASCTASSCASGVGCGSDTPTGTCTTGTGYWKTAQSCSTLTDFIGDNYTSDRTSNISGALYKCASTDNWTEYYTPYTYPHPLAATTTTSAETTTTTSVPLGTCQDWIGEWEITYYTLPYTSPSGPTDHFQVIFDYISTTDNTTYLQDIGLGFDCMIHGIKQSNGAPISITKFTINGILDGYLPIYSYNDWSMIDPPVIEWLNYNPFTNNCIFIPPSNFTATHFTRSDVLEHGWESEPLNIAYGDKITSTTTTSTPSTQVLQTWPCQYGTGKQTGFFFDCSVFWGMD